MQSSRKCQPLPCASGHPEAAAKATGAHSAWGRTEGTCGEGFHKQIKQRIRKSQILDYKLISSEILFFLDILSQRPSIVTSPKRVLITSHPSQRAAQPPKPSDKVTKFISAVLHCPQGQTLQEKMAGSSHALSISLNSNCIKLSSTWLQTDEDKQSFLAKV